MCETRESIVVISSEVSRVSLGVFLPPRALVVHRVLQAVPAFVYGGVKARAVVPRAPVLVQVLKNVQRSYSSVVGISSEVLCVLLGVYLPPRALVIHRVLQTVPVFAMGGVKARVRVPRAPVLVQVLESGQVPI